MSAPSTFSCYAESHYFQKNDNTGELLTLRRVRKSVLHKIKVTQSKETYDYAVNLFDELEKREKEVENAQNRVIAVNLLLNRLLNKPLNKEDGS